MNVQSKPSPAPGEAPWIPFNKPFVTGKEQEYIAEVLQRRHFCGDGPFTLRCQKLLEQITGVGRAMLTTSCTHALEMSAMLANVGPGDEVIFPSFTFVSTLNAFVIHGAVPI